MITYKTGNLLDDDADVLVNPVNCVGTMGKGLAYQFKKAYPENYRRYVLQCARVQLRPGDVMVSKHREKGKLIINFVTKDHWRDPSQYKWIQAGLASLLIASLNWAIPSMAIPALGCGNGKLAWAKVKPMIEGTFKEVDIDVRVYEPKE